MSDKNWGVWNVTRQVWLLGPAMTEEDAKKAAVEWNGRANAGERFEPKQELAEGSRMRTQEQMKADEAAAERAPKDKDGIWVNVSTTGGVAGNTYVNKEWADHYGAPHGYKSERYVPGARVLLVAEKLQMLRDALNSPHPSETRWYKEQLDEAIRDLKK